MMRNLIADVAVVDVLAEMFISFLFMQFPGDLGTLALTCLPPQSIVLPLSNHRRNKSAPPSSWINNVFQENLTIGGRILCHLLSSSALAQLLKFPPTIHGPWRSTPDLQSSWLNSAPLWPVTGLSVVCARIWSATPAFPGIWKPDQGLQIRVTNTKHL